MDASEVDLKGQVALVTGGGRGLGRYFALALAKAGAAVAVVGRAEQQLAEVIGLIQKDGGRALAVSTDVTDVEAVTRMAQTVEQELGAVDLLVNNAGLVGIPGPIWEADPDDWRRVIDVNVNGVFLCARAVLKFMIPRGRGRIINLATGASLSAPANMSAYAVSKTALARLTEAIASDSESHGIKVFSMAPGTVRTDMAEYLIESEAGRTHVPWFREFVLGGGDVPGEVPAGLIVLLASGKLDSLSGRFVWIGQEMDHLLLHAEQIKQDDLLTLRLRDLPT